ncbi:MAG TPA: hypothetical protein VNQ53_07345 [Nocardioides sp.]|nr:hypothetical protein [Nocardioides sp.]
MSEPATGPVPPVSRTGLPFVLRILGGCLVVAVVVGAGLAVERYISDDDLALPDEVGGLAVDDSNKALDLYDYNDERVSDAYDGADAITRLYGRDSDSPLVVTVVEAESGPPLPTGFDDPEALDLSAPLNELVDKGDVTCLLTRNAQPADEGAGDPVPVAVLCQRTHGDLTVRVLGTQEPDLDTVVDATDEVWEELT